MNEQERHDVRPEDLADKILGRIEKEKVEPQPRWHFIAKNAAFWSLWVLSVLAGAAAVAATLFVFANSGWEYAALTHDTDVSFLMEAMPALWLVTLALLVLAAYVNFRHTRRGYRLPLAAVIGFGMAGSLIVGVVFFKAGVGDVLERSLGPHIPMHRLVFGWQQERWVNPKGGLLAGEVLSVSDDLSSFTLRAYDGKTWTIDAELLNGLDLEALRNFKDIRVVGHVVSPEDAAAVAEFRACRILPWPMKGRAYFMPGPERFEPLRLERPIPTSSDAEINVRQRRNTECEGVRPYRSLNPLPVPGPEQNQ